ncbi:MAG: NUDIX domain-containing protein, partial [Gammaproteobacteria bacterium]
MAESVWKPRATVAALCERDGKYLLVREEVDGKLVYNQPAGHLDPNETLVQAVIRETLEETRYLFRPTALQGIYRYQPHPENPDTYLRFLFRGEVTEKTAGPLD